MGGDRALLVVVPWWEIVIHMLESCIFLLYLTILTGLLYFV